MVGESERRVGVVTGAGRGMGLACARRLAGLVDVLLLVDLDHEGAAAAADELNAGGGHAEPFAADVTDADALIRLARHVAELGTLRLVAHAAGISPSMGDWRRILTVDLVATALLVDTLRPRVTAGTAIVCFASMAPLVANLQPDPEAAAVLDDPLDPGFLDRIRAVLGPTIENPGAAYAWAKLGVQRLVQREAVRLGELGARICSVSPGITDTAQSRLEAASHPSVERLVQQTPLGRRGQPDEVAAVVEFLLSAGASFLSGVDLPIDGGLLAAVRTQSPM